MEFIGSLPKGKVLCLAECEGRNAVWLAQQGRVLTAMDASEVGLAKAWRLADARGMSITTVNADLAAFAIESQHWDAIVSSVICRLSCGTVCAAAA